MIVYGFKMFSFFKYNRCLHHFSFSCSIKIFIWDIEKNASDSYSWAVFFLTAIV